MERNDNLNQPKGACTDAILAAVLDNQQHAMGSCVYKRLARWFYRSLRGSGADASSVPTASL